MQTQGWRRRFQALARLGSRPLIAALLIAPALSLGLAEPVAQIVSAQQREERAFGGPVFKTKVNINPVDKASPYSSTVNVTGVRGQVLDVNVILYSVDHPRPSDISVMLEHQGRQTVIMRNASDGTALRTANIILDQDGGHVLPGKNAPLVGARAYRPRDYKKGQPFGDPAPTSNDADEEYLDFFRGMSATGDWTLWIRDDRTPIGGTIKGWQLEIITDSDKAPFYAADKYVAKRGEKLKIDASEGVLRNDGWQGAGNLRVRLLDGPSKGKFHLFSSGAFTFKPKNRHKGDERFTYEIIDEFGSVVGDPDFGLTKGVVILDIKGKKKKKRDRRR